ncbi:hypothetical protein BGW36DRAFT_390799 [Talaromyces proteolyticus]|uniref:ER transporter 6TM N-terminal domain-containing protein n=1 Tax=Talaromyces proteolyticus TaxID=1131652 RepID=A0AAD4KE07_9EURO|nr:uncharacterized protein BGW36DRAFT_390799 [Talaromyces proteolyticus]KAH8689403.1 hypothetical protein BGW36DRAFT_390799 [Talaromyces proteolyticus]
MAAKQDSHHGAPSPTISDSRSMESQDTKKPSSLARMYGKMDIDLQTFLKMLKAAIPSTVAVAMYQAGPVANEYKELGYLIGVIALYSRCCAPRGKYIQFLIQCLLCVCFGAASAFLMAYCCVEARKHTSTPVSEAATSDKLSVPYNSTASAVAGIWLFFQMYILNSLRAKNPQLNYPVVMHNMLFHVAAVNAPSYTDVTTGTAAITLILKATLTGLGLATATHFLILPDTSREVVSKLMGDYIDALQGTLKAHVSYFESMESIDMFVRVHTSNLTEEKKLYRTKADAIKDAARNMSKIHSNLGNELPFAKREVAFGKLGPDDLARIFKHLRSAMTPINGLSTVVDIFERLMKWNNWDKPVEHGGVDPNKDAVRARMVHDWNMIMGSAHDSFSQVIEVMNEGLQHVAYQLRLKKRPKRDRAVRKDPEASAKVMAPGDEGFAEYVEAKSKEFYMSRLVTLREWCVDKGIELPKDYFDRPVDQPIHLPEDMPGGLPQERNERQLYILLYVEHMLYSSSRAILDLVRFADERVASGKLQRNRVVVPGSKQFRKWIFSFFEVQDDSEDNGDGSYHRAMLDLGQAYQKRKDPEHLPPENTIEKIGEGLRMIPSFLRSTRSQFGLRVAFATMSIGIIAFLEPSRSFFVSHRLVWAMIMTTISMSPTAAQTISNFVFRCVGTILAMIGSMLIWYIPNGHPAGVVVVLFVWTTIAWWVPLKRPLLQVAGIVGMTTTLIIIGYEIEVQKLGKETMTASGQEYYPTYLLAPYRLAVVIGGLFVAFIWTVFPFPISDHSVLRQDLGTSLYLLARYYSLVHDTMTARARGDEGDLALKTSAGRRLERARNKVYAKQTLAINRLRTYSNTLRWEIPIGGRFPKEHYDRIIECMQNMVNYLNLVEFASKTFSSSSSFPPPSDSPSSSVSKENNESEWFHDFKKLIATTESTSHRITSVLALLSASISNAQPLPPYLDIPRPYSFSEKLKEVDKDILNISHAAEPGYAAFSVLQIASRCVVGDLEKLIESVKELVGELDFSFHVIKTSSKKED